MTKEIPLSRGMIALVDDADFDWLNQWKWHVTAGGYAQRRETKSDGGAYILMHRLIVAAPGGVFADHINHDTLDNRRDNLRLATTAQSIRNTRAWKNRSSVFKGVRLSRNRWAAVIQANGTVFNLGFFLTQREAAQAYNEAAIQHHGEFACLNDLSILPAEQDAPLQPRRGLKSPFRGIYKDERRGHWVAECMINRTKTHIGSFASDFEAACAYDEFVKAHGLQRKINFP